MTITRPTVTVAEAAEQSLDPASPPLRGTSNIERVAARPGTLDGAVLAIVDDGFNSPGLPTAILRRLTSQFDIADVLWAHKDSVSVPPKEEDWAQIVARATAGLALYGG